MEQINYSKNIVYKSTIHATGNVHIGDIIYTIKEDFQESILFLQIQPVAEKTNQYTAQLFIKSPHAGKAALQTGQALLIEPITVEVSEDLLKMVGQFQESRRGDPALYRNVVTRRTLRPEDLENELTTALLQTFFAGDIGTVCRDFIELLHQQKVQELLLVISSESEAIRNLPWEMLIHPLKAKVAGNTTLGNTNFGLIRTTGNGLERFDLNGEKGGASPLKLLFITALPENLTERGKMLEIEDEQKKLIEAIGGLEAIDQPKIVIEFLDNAALTEIETALTARRHDILHISGHGSFDAKVKKGVLYLEDEEGDEAQIQGKELGELLQRHNCIRLLILSACETAIAGDEGTGEQLAITSGIPAILGMRFAITDKGAKAFTTVFYERIAKGESLTKATAEAREQLWQNIRERRKNAPNFLHSAEWFTPVLYQNQYVAALTNKAAYEESIRSDFYPKLSFLKGAHTKLVGQGFIGRKAYLIRLRKAFANGQPVCLHGLGGLGKTTLAEAFADNYRKRYGHQIILFRGGSQINEKLILDRLLEGFEETNPAKSVYKQLKAALESKAEPTQKLQFLLDNYLKGRKHILIFDNFEDVQQEQKGKHPIADKFLANFISYLVKHAPANCHLLFTTRYSIAGLEADIHHFQLDKMSYAEQYRYMNFSEVLRSIPIAKREMLHRRLDGHPRSLEYLEGFKRKSSGKDWEALQGYLQKAENKVFDNLLLEKLYAQLAGPEKGLLQQAGILISRSPTGVLEAISGKTKEELQPLLQNLQDWSLCYWDEKEERLEVHALTREWLRQQEQLDAITYRAYALKVGQYFQSNPTNWGDIILAKDYFEIAEAWEKFGETSFRLDEHYQLTGFNEKALALNQQVLEKPIGEIAKVNAWNNIGLIQHIFGKYEEALNSFQKGLEINKKRGNYQGEAANLNNIARIHKIKGDYDKAMPLYQQSLKILQEVGYRKGEGTTLNNISAIHYAKGDYDKALSFLQQSLKIRREIEDREGEGESLNNIAEIHRTKRDYDKALLLFQQSLKIAQEIGNRFLEGGIMNNIALIHYTKKDYNKAMPLFQQSLKIKQEVGDTHGEANTLHNIGCLLYDQEKLEAAVPYLMQAYSILEQMGSPNAKNTEEYLSAIIKKIGEERFKELISGAS